VEIAEERKELIAMRTRLLIWIIGLTLFSIAFIAILDALMRLAPVLTTIGLSLLCGLGFIWMQVIGRDIANDVFSHMYESDD